MKNQEGSQKVGELHVSRANYCNYEANDSKVLFESL
jgi:hypothetical protein